MDAPQIGTGSFTIEADLALSSAVANGVLIADGDRFGGYTLYAKDGIVVFEQCDLGDRSELRANRPLDSDVKTVTLRFERSDAKGGTATILYDNTPVGSGHIAKRATRLTSVAGFSVGFDTSGPVSEKYGVRGGFPFPSGQLRKVVVKRNEGVE